MTDNIVYAMAPPPGVSRDPEAPGHSTSLIAIVCTFLPLAGVAMVIRLYTRARITRRVAIDDYVMLVAFCFGTFLNIEALLMLNYGLGKHLWNVPLEPDLNPDLVIRDILVSVAYFVAMGCAKCSILLLYLRIFTTTGIQRIIWAVLVYTAGFSFAAAATTLFSCNPVTGAWIMKATDHVRCINSPAFYFANAGLNITSDLMTVAIPIPKLFTLRMPWRRKVAASLALSVGGLVCFVSVIRLWNLYTLLTDLDLTYNIITTIMWCCLEINLSIIGGCAATLKPFIKHAFPRLIGASSASEDRRSGRGISLQDRPSNKISSAGDKEGTTKTTLEGVSQHITNIQAIETNSGEHSTGRDPSFSGTIDLEAGHQPELTSSRQREDWMGSSCGGESALQWESKSSSLPGRTPPI